MNNVPGSQRAQRELSRHRKEREDQQERDLKWVLSTAQGRRFMFDLIDRRCLLFSQSYTGNSETYLREGQRKVGIDLTKDIQAKCKDEYVLMISEAFSLKKRDDLMDEVAQKVAEDEE